LLRVYKRFSADYSTNNKLVNQKEKDKKINVVKVRKMNEIPVRIDDTSLLLKDDLSKQLSEKLKGEPVGLLPISEEEKRMLKEMLKKRRSFALIIPERVELIHWLGGILKETKETGLEKVLEGILVHEFKHLDLLKRMPIHRSLSIAIDGLLLSYVSGFEAEKVGRYIELCLWASNIRTKWLHEGSAIIAEMEHILPYSNIKEVNRRVKEFESLKSNLTIEKGSSDEKAHEIGLNLITEVSKNLKTSPSELVNYIYGFYGVFKIKNFKFLSPVIPDYLLFELAKLKFLDYEITIKDLPQIIPELSRKFVGPCKFVGQQSYKVERISPFYYAPVQELRKKTESRHLLLELLPEEFKALCRPIVENLLIRKPLIEKYVVWDLSKNRRILYTCKISKNKETLSKVILEIQKLRDTILPIFLENLSLTWQSDIEDFNEFIEKAKYPQIDFGIEHIKWLSENQAYFQEKYEKLVKEVKGLCTQK